MASTLQNLEEMQTAIEKMKAFLDDTVHHPLMKSWVLRDVMREYTSAKAKHGDMAIDGAGMNEFKRLAALMEEVGEVAETFSYDEKRKPDALYKELIQVASVALSWASMLPQGTEPFTQPVVDNPQA